MNSKRISWVDSAKGIGIIFVVYGHVARGIFESGLPINSKFFKYVDNIIYTFHIPLFFFLAGLFFFKTLKKGHLYFLKHKICYILYPYLLWSLIQGIIMIKFSKFTNSERSFSELYNILFMPIDQFWFLYSLFFIFLLSSLIYFNEKLIESKVYTYFILFLLIIIFLFQNKIIKLPFFWFIFHNIVYFFSGIVFYLFLKKIKKFNLKCWFLIFLILFIIFQYLFNFYFHLSYETNNYAFSLLVTFISIFFIVFSSMLLGKKYSIINYIGILSLEIYILHILATSGTRIILFKIFKINNISIHIICGTLAGLFFPILLYKISKEKIKILFKLPVP